MILNAMKSSKVMCKSNTCSRLLAAGEDRKGPLSHLLPISIIKLVLAFSKFSFKNFVTEETTIQ